MLETFPELAGWYFKVGGTLGFTFGALSWGLKKAVGWPLHHVLIVSVFWPWATWRTFFPKRNS